MPTDRPAERTGEGRPELSPHVDPEYRSSLDELEPHDLTPYQRGYIDGFDAPANLRARSEVTPEPSRLRGALIDAMLDAIRAYGDARADVAYGRATRKAIDLAWERVLAVGHIPPLATSTTDTGERGETEPCPTCGQPVDVPQRGDHDYGINLAAADPLPRIEGLDAERLARALRGVDVLEGYAWEDDVPEGWRHRKLAKAIAAEYVRLGADPEATR